MSNRTPVRIPDDPTFPDSMQNRGRWIAWTSVDGGKKPVAPWETGHCYPVSWKHFAEKDYDDPRSGFETVQRYVNLGSHDLLRFGVPDDTDELQVGYAFTTAYDDEYPLDGGNIVLIDFDDARDPESGDVHWFVQEFIDNGHTFCQYSNSGDVHGLGIGTLPEGVGSIEADLPEDDRFPDAQLEVYDHDRFIAMTGDHVLGTPSDLCDINDLLQEWSEEFVTTPDSRPNQMTLDPVVSKDDLSNVDETDEIRDVFDAVQHVSPSDIRIDSPVTEERSGGVSRDPTWALSESGTRLWQYPDNSKGPWFNYRKGHHGLDCLHLVALEEGIVSDVDQYPTGDQFWEAVDALRKRGAHIPEYVPTLYRHNQAVVLPELDAGSDDDGDTTPPSREEIHTRIENIIRRAVQNGDNILLDALMGTGKTYSFGKIAGESEKKFAYFTQRTDLYQQMRDIALENDIPTEKIKILPAMPRECPTYRGDRGDEWANRVQRQYRNGAEPKAIHEHNDNIPCREGDTKCPYEQQWPENFDDYRLLIGHYKHAHLTPVTMGRTCAFDEDAHSAFTTRLSHDLLVQSVNTFAKDYDIPIEGWADLRDNRHNPDLKREVARWFDSYQGDGWQFDPDSKGVIAHDHHGDGSYHAYTAHAIYGIVSANPTREGGNWERGRIPESKYDTLYPLGTENKGEEYVEIRHQPDLSYTRNVIALDGTPLMMDTEIGSREQAPREWEDALGRHFNVKRPMSNEERAAYLVHTMGNRFVQTSESVNPYSSARYNDPAEHAALLKAVTEHYGNGDPPVTVAPKKVIKGVDGAGMEEESVGYENRGFTEEGIVKEFAWPGNLRGSNRFASERLGVILGSTHHGDDEIARRAAWLHSHIDPDGKGNHRDYGTEAGNAVHKQMGEYETLQNALRFGRDGGGSTVVLHTSMFPDWLPVEEKGGVSTWRQSMRDVQTVFGESDGEPLSAEEIADHPAVGVGVRAVRSALTDLDSLGYVDRQKDPDDGRRSLWADAGVSALDECEMAEFEVVDVDTSVVDVDDELVVEDAEALRIKTYTSAFSNSAGGNAEEGVDPSTQDSEASSGGGNSHNHGDATPG